MPEVPETRNYDTATVSLNYLGSNNNGNQALKLSTVYRCVEVISSSVAQLPIELYSVDEEGFRTKNRDHQVAILLGTEPNEYMTRYTFFKVIIALILLKGNAFVKIIRDKNTQLPIKLELIDNDDVTIKSGKYYIDDKPINSYNILHFLNYSTDGVNGISVLKHAANTISLSANSEKHASGFFKNGANLSGILKVDTALTDKQKKDIKNSWQDTFDPITGTPNGIAVLEGNMDFQPITINPADAQLLETRQFNVVDICRFFGVSPIKVFDLTKANYSTVEATQLAFLTDTLSPLLENLELELERKLLLPSERMKYDIQFNETSLLRVDKNSLAEYYNKLFNVGAITINEIRKELNLPKLENGDNNFIQVNTSTVDNIINLKTNE
ncbi:phage portal protein [Proteiniphilum acetatigenes]|uniref:phage portal protein n=1 Tax=Proteiniphilum acetatigenes TaxID=294710 RepID=UPI0005C74659|nr:phage portal protein [Proteiniphilum acetatigenes]